MSNTNKAVKKVKIRLPITRTEKEPVYVACNGHPYRIKRGVEVEVPEHIVKILQASERMKAKTIAYEESLNDKNEDKK